MCNTDLLSWLVLRNIEDHIAMFHFWDHNNTIIPKTNEQTIIVWNLYLWTGIGHVRLSYNSYFSACFFSWNNIFLSQQISWNNVFTCFFSKANGAAPVFVACNLILGSFSLPVGCAWWQITVMRPNTTVNDVVVAGCFACASFWLGQWNSSSNNCCHKVTPHHY